jgi:hypothetical protein
MQIRSFLFLVFLRRPNGEQTTADVPARAKEIQRSPRPSGRRTLPSFASIRVHSRLKIPA